MELKGIWYITASERLADAELTASTDHRRAQKDPHAYRSKIYPPGAEFSLCYAETQLMGAVVGVLNESLTESIRGFYKLRKAYITMDGILAAEAEYMKKRSGIGKGTSEDISVDSLGSDRSAKAGHAMPGDFGDGMALQGGSQPASIHSMDMDDPEKLATSLEKAQINEDDDDEDEFHEADEDFKLYETPKTYTGKVELHGRRGSLSDHGFIEGSSRPSRQGLPTPKSMPVRQNLLDHDPDSDVFANPIDVFVHSGANLCFGLLLVMISMIPPAFGKLLFIIGFHGDKDRGVRMLWQASKFHNINGAMAGLIVLGYYNTLIGFSDIIPDSDPSSSEKPIEGYPKERCEALLVEMRKRHPKSQLWLLEEARMEASNKQLSTAISVLETSTESPLKQVEALKMFEKSLDAMYSHQYDLCSKSFVSCVSLNNWSHALYYYIAGAAQVELYRRHKTSDPAAAAVYAKKAVELLKVAPSHTGKKKFMARQLPFDIFVSRKVKKWDQRSRDWDVPFVDAVGISPVEEMIFFWNGYKRMNPQQLEQSMDRLAWSENTATNPTWTREGADERALLSVLRGATLRNLKRLDEARKVQRIGVLDVDWNELKGGLRDDWTAPASHYEMGVICWIESREAAQKQRGLGAEEALVRESEIWIEKAARWESYELDARIGLKIATAQDTLKKWREKHGRAQMATG